jgi:hypothetical protein
MEGWADMSKQVLKLVSDAMESLGLQYGFGEYSGNENGEIVYPYFVGEITESESTTEDGLQESTVLLTGFSRASWLTLEDARESIENYFNRVSGKTVITDNGSGVAAFYGHSVIVPTGDAELKSIQINLSIKEWKVN